MASRLLPRHLPCAVRPHEPGEGVAMDGRITGFTFVLGTLLGGCGSFDGLSVFDVGPTSPSTGIAVSRDRIVQVVGPRTRIWARNADHTLLADLPTSALYGSLMCDQVRNGISNPRVRFDETTRRWFVVAAETRAPG